MKTVKEIAEITGISIRTLRYYDEINLLKPTKLSEAGYRLYDSKALERLQQIMFLKELELSLMEIKEIIEDPDYNKEHALHNQKELLEKKRNRLNGIIELISDVMKGVNTMSFEAFNDSDINKILDHMKQCMSQEEYEELIQKYGDGSFEKFRELFEHGLKDDKVNADFVKWYGSKEKAVAAALETTEDLSSYQDENSVIYKQLAQIKDSDHFVKETDSDHFVEENDLITKLADFYKRMFHLDNARAMLLDLANEYLKSEKLAEVTDSQYGSGFSEYVAKAIKRYYGI